MTEMVEREMFQPDDAWERSASEEEDLRERELVESDRMAERL